LQCLTYLSPLYLQVSITKNYVNLYLTSEEQRATEHEVKIPNEKGHFCLCFLLLLYEIMKTKTIPPYAHKDGGINWYDDGYSIRLN
jgi:hypothetical protein